MIIIAGIDYSMTTPGITIAKLSPDGTIDPKNCSFHFLAQKKKDIGMFFGNVTGYEYPEWNTQEERLDKISDWAMSVVKVAKYAFIEEYAFAAKGKVFNIGENTGLLKHKLYKSGISYETVPIKSIKLMATGKGGAKKPDMYHAFKADTGNGLDDLGTQIDKSPIADVCDSYWVAKCGMDIVMSERDK